MARLVDRKLFLSPQEFADVQARHQELSILDPVNASVRVLRELLTEDEVLGLLREAHEPVCMWVTQ